MKYKILILFIVSVLLSGCINPIDNTGNFSKLPEDVTIANNIPAKSITVSYDDQQLHILVYHINENGLSYTCFTVNNNPGTTPGTKGISCTRDYQAVI